MYKSLYKKTKKIFIPFFMIGDPDYETSLDLVLSACEAGVDALELGIPYTDPIADGPVIQKANMRAFESGMNLENVFKFISEVRKQYKDIPIGILTYYNLIFSNGEEAIIKKFAESGVNSILSADLPPEYAKEFSEKCKKFNIDNIFIISANTDSERFKYFNEYASGFVYLVSLYGITGVRNTLNVNLEKTVNLLKEKIEIPICVGFGISTAKHVKQVFDTGAWGAIVGSAIVKLIEDNIHDKKNMKKSILDLIKKMIEAKNG